MSDKTEAEKQNKIQIPFSCNGFLVVWRWQEESSVSWSDFEGEEGEVSPEAEERVSFSGSHDPSWDSVRSGDVKTSPLAPGVRGATPKSDSGEETLQPLGRSDLVTCVCVVRERLSEGCWYKRLQGKLCHRVSVLCSIYLERERNLWMLAYFWECTVHNYSPINNAANKVT